uniref:Spt20-like SEP domain-containing protein n=1 Tax=Percolomonas cosmopolitus TaxID=63605 RepID=A0A7S1PIN2_9EUKA|mmetsp:Transcript_7398/g.27633  ORF Transcript_7398/g.27633 Transcript_7398/m.27633 type:complete len:763 (+) Transcript_7398:211-2499(+)
MPPKRKRGTSSTKKRVSLSDIFDYTPTVLDDEDNESFANADIYNDSAAANGVLSVPNIVIRSSKMKMKKIIKENGGMAMDEDEMKDVDEVENGETEKTKNISPTTTTLSNISAEEFTNLLLSSNMFPCTQLELEIERYINEGATSGDSTNNKKRSHWDRDLDTLQSKIEEYRESGSSDNLLSEVLDLVHELRLDNNVALLAKYLNKTEDQVRQVVNRRKRAKMVQKESISITTTDTPPSDLSLDVPSDTKRSPAPFPDSFSSHDTTLDILFNQKSNILSTMPASQVNSMVISLQFLIYNNEFVIQYGLQRQICQYNPITNSFLQEIASGILPKVLLESLETLPQAKFYDGCLLVELKDHRTKLKLKHNALHRGGTLVQQPLQWRNKTATKAVKLLLKPDLSSAFASAKQYLEENCNDVSEEEKYEALQHILNTIHKPLNLEPNPRIAQIANAIHYNHNKHKFRRLVKRTVSRTLMPSNPAPTSMTIQSSMMRTRKHDHSLLNHIVRKGWKKERPADLVPVLPRGSVQPKSDLIKQLRDEVDETKKGVDCKSPLHFLQETSDFLKNYRKNVRILQFQAVHEPQRVWRIEIFPAHKGRRYDCILAPSGQPPSKWIIGSKHAAELYGARLKDMFMSNGRTYCSGDVEMDYSVWEEKRKRSSAQQQAATAQNVASTPNTASTSNAASLTSGTMGNTTPGSAASAAQRPQYSQITNNMRIQNGQMQNLPFNGGSFSMQVPQNQALQGNIHAQHLHQFINQQQKKRDT